MAKSAASCAAAGDSMPSKARDSGCAFPGCSARATRSHLDHTQPWEADGLTCSCNLGALCRHHHMLKQHPGWQLRQARPGTFEWITPPGRAYTCLPDRYAA